MRSRKILLVLGLIGATFAGFGLSGCSSDDRPTPPEPTINDQYAYVQDEVNDVVDETIALMAATLEMFESNSDVTDTAVIADLRESPFDPDSVYTSDNWYILVSNQFSASLGGTRMIDSILFTSNGAAVEFAGLGDGIVLRHIYQFADINTDQTYTDYDTEGDLVFSGLNTTSATISGEWSATTIAQVVDVTTEIRTYTIDAQINNLVVAKLPGGWAGGCPASGSIDFSVDLSYQNGDDVTVESSWDFTVTFTDGSASVSVSDGTVSTSYTNAFCTP